MMYSRLQNYTNMMVGEHGIQVLEVVIVVSLFLLLSFDVLIPTNTHPSSFLDKWFIQNT